MLKYSYNQKGHILIEEHLPHNFLAEKMILNSLLINSEAIEITLQSLPVEAFYFKNHQEIYKIILTLYQKNSSIDITMIITFIQNNGLLDNIGGINVLFELIYQIPNITHLKEYISLVRDKFLRRSLIKLGYQIIDSSYITNSTIEEILNNFEDKLFNLTVQLEPHKLLSSADLLNKILINLKEISLNPKLSGVLSGFSELDKLTHGFQKSDFLILAGRPSIGKTALSLNMALNILKNSKLPVLFFSLEMSKEQIMYRLLSIETNINQLNLRSGNLSKNDWLKLNKIIKIISKLPFFIDDTPNLTIQDIRAKIKLIIFNYMQIGLIIIDYIQLMHNLKLKFENRTQELSKITRELKNIAQEFNIPILVLSQLSRNVESRVDKKPILSDLRESGSIEQDADIVLMLYKNKDFYVKQNNTIIELIIAKHRNGPTGIVKLKFDEKRTKFFNF